MSNKPRVPANIVSSAQSSSQNNYIQSKILTNPNYDLALALDKITALTSNDTDYKTKINLLVTAMNACRTAITALSAADTTANTNHLPTLTAPAAQTTLP